jgi:UDP-N-acetylmuramoylalanine--D-glutamate ligase
VRISQLEGHNVAIWGWGREGHAAWRAIRAQLPSQPLTLLCSPAEAQEAALLGDVFLSVHTGAVDAALLSSFAVVVKSPGISPYRPEAQAAAAAGTRFIGGTRLWFAGHPQARTVCVTGTKGKSTTTSLLAHLLRSGGHCTALAGNIGLPLLDLPERAADGREPEFFAIELSSYQTADVAAAGVRPEVAVVLNIFPEHLDWHGSQERYVDDKLQLVTRARPRTAVLNAADPHLQQLHLPDSKVVWFNREDGWHLRGEVLYRGDERVFDTGQAPLPGHHNRANLCAVLAAIEALGVDAVPLAPAILSFRPLPHRLQWLGERDGLAWVNDSISTTPHASLAALDCHRTRRVAILLGGHDRGLDWSDFAAHLDEAAPVAVVTMGANGPRIHHLLEPLAAQGRFALEAAAGLEDAVARARRLLGQDRGQGQGLVLLSPGAPSFGAYRDYTERGRHFAALAGFDPDRINAIAGLGLA